MFVDLLCSPTAADKVANHRVKGVAAISPGRGTFAYNLINVFDGVARPAIVEAVAVELSLGCRFCLCSFAALSPGDAPAERTIDIDQLFHRAELQTCNGQDLRGTAE